MLSIQRTVVSVALRNCRVAALQFGVMRKLPSSRLTSQVGFRPSKVYESAV